MVDQILVTLVDNVLGRGKNTSKNNRAYTCPFCKHHKPKLEVNFTPNDKNEFPWNCWVCGTKGRSLINLFKKIEAEPDKLGELRFILKSTTKEGPQITVNTKVSLPKEFKSLSNPNSSDIIAKHALKYLHDRGITQDDIVKYNIGFCDEGKYSNRVIIPSYDGSGSLNYFTARTFDPNNPSKYKNPDVSRDIIPLELFINWSSPIVLCEGMFDAIAIKRNVIPLLGKNIQSTLMKKLVTSQVDKIYIALDKDAIKKALDFCEQLINEGKEVYLVEMDDKDPSEMGFEHFTKLIQNTLPLTFSDLFEKKLFQI